MTQVKFVSNVEISEDAFLSLMVRLDKFIVSHGTFDPKSIIVIADGFLRNNSKLTKLHHKYAFNLIYYDNKSEPSTNYIDELKAKVIAINNNPICIVGIGGGSTLDSAKALSNILTNPGNCEDYQGWDLVRNQGIYKIGIPTLFGTGSETSRTCVLLNTETNIKLGMNSNFSVFDELIIDSKLSISAPIPTKIMTALDGYFHAIEIIDGKNRNIIADSFAEKSLNHFINFVHADTEKGFDELAMSSFYGGMALSNGIVGLIHPFSAALSSVFGVSHARGNCLAMKGLSEYYPERSDFFWKVVNKFNLEKYLIFDYEVNQDKFGALYSATVVHTKPLSNHLGLEWSKILDRRKVEKIFSVITKGV